MIWSRAALGVQIESRLIKEFKDHSTIFNIAFSVLVTSVASNYSLIAFNESMQFYRLNTL